MRELVVKARAASGTPNEVDRVMGELSVSLVQDLLELTETRESREQLRARQVLGRLLESEEVQRFSTAVTDRFHRPQGASRRMKTFLDLARRTRAVRHLPWWERAQVGAAQAFGPVVPDLTAGAIMAKVRAEAAPYVWSAEPAPLARLLAERRAQGYFVNLNYVGEEVIGDQEAERRFATYRKLVQREDIHAVSVKLSGIEAQLDLTAFDATLERLFARMRVILLASLGRAKPVLVYLDMEAYRDLALSEALVHRILRTPELDATHLGLAVQTYLPEASGLVERLARTSNTRVWRGGQPLRIRLVKGANLKMEQVEASMRRWAVPTFDNKRDVDANFKRTLRQLLVHASHGRLTAGIGSHNLFDLAYAWLLVERSELSRVAQLEMLEGMAGAIGETFRKFCGGILLYAPAVKDESFSSAVSYLVRRLDENTAPENFLRILPTLMTADASFEEQVVRFHESLAHSRAPVVASFRTQDRDAETETALPVGRWSAQTDFENAADTDWTRAENRAWLARHKKRAEAMVPEVSSLLAFEPALGAGRLSYGFDPSRPQHGYPVTLCLSDSVERALAAAAASTFPRLNVEARVGLLHAVADGLSKRRGELIAAMVYDAGKRVDEADVEVSEAIDFARYYAACAEQGLLGRSRGVVTVTPPWNFPLAIPLGGTFAALAAGNPVLLKPAPETPWVAHLATQICHQAGIPRDALQLVICDEKTAGPLIQDARVSSVILTGATSTAQAFLRMRPGLHLMAETGGKNAAYVSAVADHDHALSEVVKSAFGHSGQKCSALSLLILEQELFDDPAFRSKLKDAVESLPVGSAWDARSKVTPLIRRPSGPLLQIIETGAQYGTWLVKPLVDAQNPRLVSPGVLWGIAPGSFPHVTEFFGPILAVLRARDLHHGMQLLNQTRYGLTAGLFSLDEGEQETFVQVADAGNLYLNRGITGAVVGRQPFGGRKDSSFGPGAKAGGPDYVGQFTRASPASESEAQTPTPEHLAQRWAERQASYRAALREHYGKVHEGTPVVGEHNYFRYTTASVFLVLDGAARELDVKSSLLAHQLTRNAWPVFVLRDAVKKRSESSDLLSHCQEAGIPAELVSVTGLLERAQKYHVTRLRVVGLTQPELTQGAAQRGISLLADPVSDAGRMELLPYLVSQSISFAYHRHGNTSLAVLSRLKETLSVWSLETD